MEKILAEEHLIQRTIYFKFYLFRALQRKGEHGIVGEIILPLKLKGTFLWGDFNIELKEGRNKIDIN